MPYTTAPQQMANFRIQNVRFVVRAAAILLAQEHILLHRRADDTFWALPGGKVEVGEVASQAVMREIREEIGEAITCQKLAFCVENFFEHAGECTHELGYYFFAHLVPGTPLTDKSKTHPGIEKSKRLEYRWFRVSELHGIDLRPAFLRNANLAAHAETQHVVQGKPHRLEAEHLPVG